MKDIKEELKEFQKFKSNYIFKQKKIEEIDGKQYCEGEPLIDEEGKEINRFSKEYDDLVDELYISAIQNPLYRNILKTTNRDIIHTMGVETKEETVFTRYEFELQLNCLKDFLKEK